MAKLRLSREDIFELIENYRNFECLWNYKSSSYKRIDLKRKAWEEIAVKFNSTVEEIKKKVKYIRSAYVTEKKKVEDSKKSGSSADIYEPNLFYYSSFSFLEEAIVLRKTSCNFEESKQTVSVIQEGIEAAEEASEDNSNSVNAVQLPSSSQKYKRKKKSEKLDLDSEKFDEAIGAIVNFATNNPTSPPEQDDMYSIFGKGIGIQLRDLPPSNASKAMAQIQQIVTEHTIEVLFEKRLENHSKPNAINIISNRLIAPSASSSYWTSPSDLNSFTFSPSLSSSLNSDTLVAAVVDADIFDDATQFNYSRK